MRQAGIWMSRAAREAGRSRLAFGCVWVREELGRDDGFCDSERPSWSILRDGGAAKSVVYARRNQIDVLTDVVGCDRNTGGYIPDGN
jgi:hypothetical protein